MAVLRRWRSGGREERLSGGRAARASTASDAWSSAHGRSLRGEAHRHAGRGGGARESPTREHRGAVGVAAGQSEVEGRFGSLRSTGQQQQAADHSDLRRHELLLAHSDERLGAGGIGYDRTSSGLAAARLVLHKPRACAASGARRRRVEDEAVQELLGASRKASSSSEV